MENATKALIIATSVLIGILILSLGVSLFGILRGYVTDTESEIERNNIRQFNEQFLKYDRKTDLTIQDVVTAQNLALEINNSFSNYDTSIKATQNTNYVDVFFKRESSSNTIFNKDMIELLEKYIDVKNIKCTVTISPVTGRVYKLVFE